MGERSGCRVDWGGARSATAQRSLRHWGGRGWRRLRWFPLLCVTVEITTYGSAQTCEKRGVAIGPISAIDEAVRTTELLRSLRHRTAMSRSLFLQMSSH